MEGNGASSSAARRPRKRQEGMEEAVVRVRPSSVAGFATFRCERRLWKELCGQGGGRPTAAARHEAAARCARGVRHEAAVTAAFGGRLLDAARHGVNDLGRWTAAPAGTVIGHARFRVPDSFYTADMRRAGVEVSTFVPDFIEVRRPVAGFGPDSGPGSSAKVAWFVIDAKASRAVHPSHRLQVAIYALLLESVLDEAGVTCVAVHSKGGVWLPGAPGLEEFCLGSIKPSALRLLRLDIPRLVSGPLEDAEWFVGPKCAGCENLDECRRIAPRQSVLSLVPHMSDADHRWMRSQLDDVSLAGRRPQLADLEDLIEHPAKRPGRSPGVHWRSRRLMQCRLVNGRVEAAVLESYRRQEPVHLGRPTLALPRNEGFSLVPCLAVHPADNSLLCWSVRLENSAGEPEIPPRSYCRPTEPGGGDGPAVSLTESGDRGLNGFVESIHKCMNHAERKRVPLCVLHWDDSERLLLRDFLLGVVQGAGNATGDNGPPGDVSRAMECAVNLVEDASLLQVAETVPLPDLAEPAPCSRSVVLAKAVRDLVAIPAVGLYTYEDCRRWLLGGWGDGRLASVAEVSVFDLWAGARGGCIADDAAGAIACMMARRAEEIGAMARRLRELTEGEALRQGRDVSSLLPAAPPVFRTAACSPPWRHPVLSRLAFFKRHDAACFASSVRLERVSVPLSDRLASGKAFLLEWDGWAGDPLDGCARCRLVTDYDPWFSGSAAVPAEDKSQVKRWLLSPLCDEADAMQFDDLARISQANAAVCGRLATVDVVLVVPDGDGFVVVVRACEGDQLRRIGLAPPAGGGIELEDGRSWRSVPFLLQPRHVDVTLQCSLNQLRLIDSRPGSVFCDLVADPNAWSLSSPAKATADAGNARDYDMTPSQLRAWEQLWRGRLCVIWGPAGSGKTHTLALLALCWSSGAVRRSPRSRSSKPFVILITGFTNAAIDTVLRRTVSLCRRLLDFEFVRLVSSVAGSWRPPVIEQTAANFRAWARSKANAHRTSAPRVWVIAATVWQARKIKNDVVEAVDLLIIDEGSQLPLADAAIAIDAVHRSRGRILVAGDPTQLGPLAAEEYPLPRDPRAVHAPGSVLAALMRNDEGERVDRRALLLLPDPSVPHEPDADDDGAAAPGPCTVVLAENFRMNRDLGELAQRTTYGRAFRTVNPDLRAWPLSERSLRLLSFRGKVRETRRLLRPETAVAMLRLSLAGVDRGGGSGGQTVRRRPNATPVHLLARLEAAVVARLAAVLFGDEGPEVGEKEEEDEQGGLGAAAASLAERIADLSLDGEAAPPSSSVPERRPKDHEQKEDGRFDPRQPAGGASASGERTRDSCGRAPDSKRRTADGGERQAVQLFVVTPHHVQRLAVRAALGRRRATRSALEAGAIAVDTVERTQGRQAEVAFVCLGALDADAVARERAFLYNVRRLHVAVTRARCKTLLVASDAVMEPFGGAGWEAACGAEAAAAAEGWSYLKTYEEEARRRGAAVTWMVDAAHRDGVPTVF